MDLIGSLFLLVLVIVVIVLFVTQPLKLRSRAQVEDSQALSTLLAERDRVLNTLKELDFDNSLGKIPPETYPQQRLGLVQQGAEILRKIDQLAAIPEPGPEPGPTPAKTGDPVEALLSTRRLRLSAVAVKAVDENIDQNIDRNAGQGQDKADRLIASLRKDRPLKPGAFCSHCGRALLPADRFCPGCGQAVQ